MLLLSTSRQLIVNIGFLICIYATKASLEFLGFGSFPKALRDGQRDAFLGIEGKWQRRPASDLAIH